MRVQVCTLLFLRRDEEILLAMKKRGLGQGRWNGVGGKVEPGEAIVTATIRECQEEIEVTPRGLKQVAEINFTMDSDTAEPWIMQAHVFVSHEWAGEPAETDEMAPQWFKLSDIPYEQMWQDDVLWLPHVLEEKYIVADFSFARDESMLQHTVRVTEGEPS